MLNSCMKFIFVARFLFRISIFCIFGGLGISNAQSASLTNKIQSGTFPLSTSSLFPSGVNLPDGWKFLIMESLGDLFSQSVTLQKSQLAENRPTIVGLIFPKGVDPKPFVQDAVPVALLINTRVMIPLTFKSWNPKSWLVIVTFEDNGHILDSSAQTWNAEDLLKRAQETLLNNKDELGLAESTNLKLTGWAQAPRWNSWNHAVSWVKQLEIPGKQTWLYGSTYVLTATGALGFHAIAHMDQLQSVQQAMTVLRPGVKGLSEYGSKAYGSKIANYNVTDLVTGQSPYNPSPITLFFSRLLNPSVLTPLLISLGIGFLLRSSRKR
jgi:hypothetical protein